jgi:Predicted periplasmic ligand-binding sensor domain
MKNVIYLFSIINLLLISVKLEADTFSFRHYKADDGLIFNTVRSIIQDRNGFIWFGTEDGLNRFDGNAFKEFRINTTNSFSLGSNYISSLFEDSNGNIWIGTDDGVYIYHTYTESFSRFLSKANGIVISSTINNIVEDKSRNVWLSTYGQGIFSYNLSSAKLEQYKTINEGGVKRSYDLINYVYVDHNNLVWAAPKTPNNPLILFRRSKKSFQVIPFKNDAGNEKMVSIYKIFEDSKHNFWLGTWDSGLCKFDRETRRVTNYLSPASPGGILHIHEISEYKPNLLFVGSDDGLSLFNTVNQTHQLFTSNETDPSSLSDKFVYPIFKDREGGIWIGTYFGGVNYISPNNWSL